MNLNLPNRLTVLRVILIPFFMFFIIFPVVPDIAGRVISAAIFILTAFTDFLDGMIARKFNMITDFGKFLDPLADKMMIFAALLSILVKYSDVKPFVYIFVWAAFIIILREMAVTSLRMLVNNKSGKVIAAAWLGKVKTFTQMTGIVVILLEPVIVPETSVLSGTYIFSYIFLALMTIMTVWSGIDYMRAYFPLLDPNK